uniref:Ribonuclease P/MRP subunit p14 n=26 Tax=Neognathae TaxID=8825 RepID=A0A8C5IWL6_JUNHY
MVSADRLPGSFCALSNSFQLCVPANLSLGQQSLSVCKLSQKLSREQPLSSEAQRSRVSVPACRGVFVLRRSVFAFAKLKPCVPPLICSSRFPEIRLSLKTLLWLSSLPELPDGGARPNAAQFKQLVVTALRELHGEVGAALPVDVLTYEEKTLSAILRVISSGLVKLWSALTLLGFYQNRRCAFRVLQTSPFLLALSGNSRELVLD